MSVKQPANTVYVPDRATWRAWLLSNHLTCTGVWLIYYKKESGKPRVAYADAVEEALCHGWIDGVVNPIDKDRYMQWFCPRKPRSTWSKLNKTRLEQLIPAGLMMPAGLRVIEIAKANGSWTSIDSAEAMEAPAELVSAFRKHAKAKKHFDSLAPSMRKAIFHRIVTAKQTETRLRRVEQIIDLLNRGLDLRGERKKP